MNVLHHQTRPQMNAWQYHAPRDAAADERHHAPRDSAAEEHQHDPTHETRPQMNDTMLAEELEETPPCPTRRVHAHQTRPQMNATLICSMVRTALRKHIDKSLTSPFEG